MNQWVYLSIKIKPKLNSKHKKMINILLTQVYTWPKPKLIEYLLFHKKWTPTKVYRKNRFELISIWKGKSIGHIKSWDPVSWLSSNFASVSGPRPLWWSFITFSGMPRILFLNSFILATVVIGCSGTGFTCFTCCRPFRTLAPRSWWIWSSLCHRVLWECCWLWSWNFE